MRRLKECYLVEMNPTWGQQQIKTWDDSSQKTLGYSQGYYLSSNSKPRFPGSTVATHAAATVIRQHPAFRLPRMSNSRNGRKERWENLPTMQIPSRGSRLLEFAPKPTRTRLAQHRSSPNVQSSERQFDWKKQASDELECRKAKKAAVSTKQFDIFKPSDRETPNG